MKTDIAAAILTEQVKLLYAQALPGFVATALNATLLVVGLWDVVAHPLLWGWYALILVVTLARFVLVRRYFGAEPFDGEADRWRWRFAVGATAAGICWGLAGTVLLPADSVIHQMLIMVVLAGMSAGAVPFLSSVKGVYYLYLVPSLIPLSLWLFLQSGVTYTYVGLLIMIFSVVLVVTSRRIQQNIEQSLRFRYENAALVEDLETSKAQLETAFGNLQDEVEERRRVARELRDSNQFLERIMDSATNAIFVLDVNGRFVRANRAVATMTGYPSEEIIGVHYGQLFHGEALRNVAAQFEQATRHGEVIDHYEADLLRKDGAQRNISFSLAPLREDGHISGVVGTAEDVTERKQVERMKNEFISTVSHELRTPLTSIYGSLALIDSGVLGEIKGEMKNMFKLAKRNSDRLILLINDLLDVQALEGGEMRLDMQRHELAPLIQRTIEMNSGYAAGFGVHYAFSASQRGIVVNVDAGRFNQVMANLLSNAAKFSPPGETVAVSMTPVSAGRVRVAVSDKGPGVPENFRERIFEKFAQADSTDARQRGGTGLGLNISKGLIERMGGSIGYQSEPSAGATFYIELPCVAA